MSSEAPDPDAPASADDGHVSAELFGEWAVSGIEYGDPSTQRYINVTPIAHTMGRHTDTQFKKSELSIVERLINRLMQTDENTGKKQKTTRIVREAFDVVHERTDRNPVQVLVTAVEHAGPREETVRLKYGGISVPKAVDVAPQRRVDQALKFIAQGTYNATFKSATPVEEALANQLVGAADYDLQAYPVSQKEEQERVAAAAR